MSDHEMGLSEQLHNWVGKNGEPETVEGEPLDE